MIDLEVSVYEMHAESILVIVASEKLSEGLQLIRGDFRLPTVIFQVFIPVVDRQGLAKSQCIIMKTSRDQSVGDIAGMEFSDQPTRRFYRL